MGIKLTAKPALLKQIAVPKEVAKAPKEEKPKKEKKSKLPADTYKDEIEPLEMELSDKVKLIFAVKRQGELGLPNVDIRMYMTTDVYTGFTKKGINFPLELIEEFIELVNQVNAECEEKGI